MNWKSLFSSGSGFWMGPSGSGLSQSYSGTNPNGDAGSSTVTVTCTWNPVLPTMAGGTNSAPMQNMPPPINGSGTGTITTRPIIINWSVSQNSIKRANGSDQIAYAITATDDNGTPVNVNFTSLVPANATPSNPQWIISNDSGQNTDTLQGTISSYTGSSGNLTVEYSFNGKTKTSTSPTGLVFWKIVHQTEVEKPASRIRKVLATGEIVNLNIVPEVAVTWEVNGMGNIDTQDNYAAKYSAGNNDGTMVAKASIGNDEMSIQFDIIAPKNVSMEWYDNILRQSSPLSLYYKTKVYITPAGVNFYQCRVKETVVSANPHEGYFTQYGGGHDPGSVVASIDVDDYLAGKGSLLSVRDKIGITEVLAPPYADGLFVWNIPYLYDVKKNNSWQQFKTVSQTLSLYQLNGQWTFRVKKAGADEKVP